MAERETKHETHAEPRNEPPKANAGVATKRKDQLGANLEGADVIAGVQSLLGQITGQIGAHKENPEELDALRDEIDRRAPEFAAAIAEGTPAQPPSN